MLAVSRTCKKYWLMAGPYCIRHDIFLYVWIPLSTYSQSNMFVIPDNRSDHELTNTPHMRILEKSRPCYNEIALNWTVSYLYLYSWTPQHAEAETEWSQFCIRHLQVHLFQWHLYTYFDSNLDPINSKTALDETMTWHRRSDKPLPEPMMR